MRKLFSRALLLALAAATALATVALSASSALADEFHVGLLYNRSQWKAYIQGSDKLPNYSRAIRDHGGTPLPIHVGQAPEAIDRSMAELEVLLVPGGDDVNPRYYGEAPLPQLEYVDDELDALEMRVIDAAFARGIPILGICRGLQILNVYFGGSLYQDIPTQLPHPTVSHRKAAGSSAPAPTHFVTIGSDSFRTNSFHHQGIKRLGAGLRALGRTEDGLIEIIEHEGPQLVFATQFHPEKDAPTDPKMAALLREFFERARALR